MAKFLKPYECTDGGPSKMGRKSPLPSSMSEVARAQHLNKGRIFLYGTVDYDMAEMVREDLLFLRAEKPEGMEGLFVELRSPGGYLEPAFEIYDSFMLFMAETEIPIQILVVGEAASAASSIILQAAFPGMRILSDNCSIMCHHMTLYPGPMTHKGFEDENWGERVKRGYSRELKKVYKILTSRTGKSEEEIKDLFDSEEMLSPDEAVAFGLADQVFHLGFMPTKEKGTRKQRTKSAPGTDTPSANSGNVAE